MDISNVTIRLGTLSFVAYYIEGSYFAVASGVGSALGMSNGGFRGFLSKRGTKTCKNGLLKDHLQLAGKTRFLDYDAIVSLLQEKVTDAAILETALTRLAHPPNTEDEVEVLRQSSDVDVEIDAGANASDDVLDITPSLFSPISASAGRRPLSCSLPASAASIHLGPAPSNLPIFPTVDDASPIAAPIVPDIPVVAPIVGGPIVVPLLQPQPQQLIVPSGLDWYLNPDFQVGKKFMLRKFDQSDALVADLALFQTYWTRDIPGRRDEKVSLVTITKRVSRVLLYLGFLKLVKSVADPKTLSLAACLNFSALNAFNEWMMKARSSKPGNAIEYLSAINSVCKYLYRDAGVQFSANNFAAVEVICRIRELRNRLQSLQRKSQKTEQDLIDDQKWLSWESFNEACNNIHADFNDIIIDETSATPESARLLHDTVLLHLYQCSPSRSGEVLSIQVYDWDEVIEAKGKDTVGAWVSEQRINVLSKRPLGPFTLWLADSKTFTSRGVDETSFQEDLFPDFTSCLSLYLDSYRSKLFASRSADSKHRYLFMNVEGRPFSANGDFSAYLSALLFRLTGVRSNSNLLRSAFVTNLYSSDVSDAMKRSAASVMRHSTDMAAKVYDRRMPQKVISLLFFRAKLTLNTFTEKRVGAIVDFVLSKTF